VYEADDQWLTTRRGMRDIFPEQRILNGRLAMAAQETALDKYILTKQEMEATPDKSGTR